METGLAGPGRRAHLLGRADECALLDGLLADIRRGESRCLVLRGEAGIGKTALLTYLFEAASDMAVFRAVGVESEMELAYAGLHQLCAPRFDLLSRLPTPQREALEMVFGLASAGATPDRFMVGLAVLSLLSDVSEERPVLCIVDDAQWLDQASALTLAFVARRLQADPVGIVFSAREPCGALRDLPQLDVNGLRNGDARALLASAVMFKLDAQVRDRIVAETRGNPLALLELPRGVSADQLAGGVMSATVSSATQLERSFARRAQALPGTTQQLLLLAAAEPTGDRGLFLRAADSLGLDIDAAAPAEAAGLLEIGARVRFRHPLVRSAVYAAAPLAERQTVHHALAEATDSANHQDHRVWHRAQAALGPDEDVAAELERSAELAQRRGGAAAAAAFLVRSAELTPDPERRAHRRLVAATAKAQSGAFAAALKLLDMDEARPLEPLSRAMRKRLRGQIALDSRRPMDAMPLLVDAAMQLNQIDPELARSTHLEALRAASVVGRLGDGTGRAALAARNAPRYTGVPRPIDLVLDGLSVRFTDGYVAGVPQLKRALSAICAEAGRPQVDVRWPWATRRLALELFDDEMAHYIASRNVDIAREAGALGVLPLAVNNLAHTRLIEGDLDAAAALADEADSLATATGNEFLRSEMLSLSAYCGNELEALSLIDAVERAAIARGEGAVLTFSDHARAILYNGLGRYEDAVAAAEDAVERDELAVSVWSLPELVEAAMRCGMTTLAGTAQQRLSECAHAAGTDLALGIEARARALVSKDSVAEPLYRDGIERLSRTRVAPDSARARLLYGEWLRRRGRRVDAREQLRTSHEMFGRMGMGAFAERARIELLATGEKARKRTVETRDDLTAQERQIVALAREGLSNPEIGARLFLSPRTVEWHLHKVYAKLGIRSRHQLAALAGEESKLTQL